MRAGLALVLHAHLPFVRHPEHAYFLEENWLYEAITDTYLPLLEVLRGLQRDAVPFRLTLSLSPTLVAMLRDELLRARCADYLDRLGRLGDDELRRTAAPSGGDERFHALAAFHAERYARLRRLYDEIHGDLVAAFAALEDAGCLEIITTCATHGYLPVLAHVEARRAQIEFACRSHHRHFGRYPRGLWLPECGYVEGTDRLLADAGVRYFFVDAHGLAHARPRPPLGLHAPIYTASGEAAFARDPDSSQQVWSSSEGYPGDGAYRDFYRDVGFDRPLDEIAPYIHPDGLRVATGYKYFRVTGPGVPLDRKEPYDPSAARARAAEHAADFLAHRERQVAELATRMERPPLVVAPYDAELFGHWWFEGPWFLDELVRAVAASEAVRLVTPSDYLGEHPRNAVCEPAPSSWGEGGWSGVWVDESNRWIYRHTHHAERRMRELARRHCGEGEAGDEAASGLRRRALGQAARELLLAESSDWAFILKTGTAVAYAERRVKTHLARFRRLDRDLTDGHLDARWLAEIEAQDNLFPELDFRVYA